MRRIDPVLGAGRGFGLPPPSKFRSGHLPPSTIPVSRTIPGGNDDIESGSDNENDLTTDSEGEVYGGRYSLDSSPPDDRIPNNAAHRYGKTSQAQPRYASDSMYSDVSSSMETVGRAYGNVAERLLSRNGRHPVGQNGNGFTEDESSDSAASSEFSTTQVGSINGGLPRRGSYASEGYTSSVPSWINAGNSTKKVCHA